jgi:hypothetical protein
MAVEGGAAAQWGTREGPATVGCTAERKAGAEGFGCGGLVMAEDGGSTRGWFGKGVVAGAVGIGGGLESWVEFASKAGTGDVAEMMGLGGGCLRRGAASGDG